MSAIRTALGRACQHCGKGGNRPHAADCKLVLTLAAFDALVSADRRKIKDEAESVRRKAKESI